ncbi:MAG: 39S ribosomal protein L45 [Candidatus Accumulibacter sp.]|jgi:predicted lipid-binding transport protein (Tim44 family)|nr:39S ribosomal protein L45 [Accumulibacter sp.]
MKKLLLALFLSFVTLGLAVDDAEAARFGGGRSFGVPRQITPRPAAPARQAVPTNPARTPAAAPQRGGWMGPIAGLAAGIGLAALFSHLGLGEELANVVMILLLVMAATFVFRMLFRRNAPARPMQYVGTGQGEGLGGTTAWARMPGAMDGDRADSPIPADFDVPQFLRAAKLNFVRLQAANDAGNLEDIHEFTTPEVFAEIKLQMDERGSVAQQTDVVRLDAELLEATTEGRQHVASVRFFGLIREKADGVAAPFDEVWVLTKPVTGERGWVVAGIQQIG